MVRPDGKIFGAHVLSWHMSLAALVSYATSLGHMALAYVYSNYGIRICGYRNGFMYCPES